VTRYSGNSALLKPPEDARDWFRCQTCGTPLQLPLFSGKLLFALSVGAPLALIWDFPFLDMRLSDFRTWSGILHEATNFVIFLAIATIYGYVVRLLWKSKLFQPRPCDPYSSLNLSSERMKMRGKY